MQRPPSPVLHSITAANANSLVLRRSFAARIANCSDVNLTLQGLSPITRVHPWRRQSSLIPYSSTQQWPYSTQHLFWSSSSYTSSSCSAAEFHCSNCQQAGRIASSCDLKCFELLRLLSLIAAAWSGKSPCVAGRVGIRVAGTCRGSGWLCLAGVLAAVLRLLCGRLGLKLSSVGRIPDSWL